MSKSFLGFGFGPIQSALFLFEAFRSGNFARYTVAEVDQTLVDAVRGNGGRYTINIAYPDRIEQVTVDHVQLCNPNVAEDRANLVEAAAMADEMATALPSVRFFSTGGAAAVTAILRDGLKARGGKPGILYAAENHNHAAEILQEELGRIAPLENFQILNTVIGKMSGVIADEPTIARLKLATLTPNTPRAVLVEEFNKILVSRVTLPGYTRGIPVFAEKPDLLPFEEAKLYGHNAIHALIGYLAALKGLPSMADAAGDERIMATARQAFLWESGAALISKYQGLKDPLFTPAGYRAYAEDLLARMVNPNLNDLVARVIRDPVRKLGWDDRIYGTMRLVVGQKFLPKAMAQGAAAGVLHLLSTREHSPRNRKELTRASLATLLREIWGQPQDEVAEELVELTWAALRRGG